MEKKPEKKNSGSYFGKLKATLIAFSILAAVKMLLFEPGLDEEYQLVMAYRNVKGDRLFLDMERRYIRIYRK